jgi:ABC-type transport system involved in multi-copper enzyme maturation permease subunit
MPIRLGPGPVFIYEWIATSRRWQLYALRALFVGAILIGLTLVWSNRPPHLAARETASLAELAEYGQAIYVTIALIELTLILLAAPAATAGAICLDKARGTLDHLLATDLSDAEIVLGKLGVRLIPVLGLIVCVLPVVALSSLLGGIDPLALLGSFLVAIGCAFVGCSLAMTLSVYGRKTHEVLMMTYMILIVWLMFPGLAAIAAHFLGIPSASPGAFQALGQIVFDTNPYYLMFAPYTDPSNVGLATFLAFLGACLATSAGLVGLATARVRQVALRQAGRPATPRRRLVPSLRRPSWWPRLPGPSLEFNPVAWREWHRMRPSWMMRVAWGLYTALGLLWLALALGSNGPPRANAEGIALLSSIQVAIGLLLLSVGSATSLAEERVRGSLDLLLSTPMSTRSILAGKWWGGFRRVGPVLFWPACLSIRLLLEGGSFPGYFLMIVTILAQGAVITSLGLALATWASRLGRAVALCVAAYIVFSIGWPILVAVLSPHSPLGECLIAGSPPLGAYLATGLVWPDSFRPDADTFAAAVTIWLVLDLLAAAALFVATLRSFDRCLGRMPGTGELPRPRPRISSEFLTTDREAETIRR